MVSNGKDNVQPFKSTVTITPQTEVTYIEPD